MKFGDCRLSVTAISGSVTYSYVNVNGTEHEIAEDAALCFAPEAVVRGWRESGSPEVRRLIDAQGQCGPGKSDRSVQRQLIIEPCEVLQRLQGHKVVGRWFLHRGEIDGCGCVSCGQIAAFENRL